MCKRKQQCTTYKREKAQEEELGGGHILKSIKMECFIYFILTIVKKALLRKNII
jgi:hypothetical protein